MLGVFGGILLGLYFGIWSGNAVFPCIHDETGGQVAQSKEKRDNIDNNFDQSSIDNVNNIIKETNSDKLLLVGVMTAKKYLTSRVVSSFETWAKNIPGKVIYFSSQGSEKFAPPGLPVIGLKGVDDSYPPQKKSFLMIKYMYEYFGDQFEWFIRADDDIYIKSYKMTLLLNSINSSRPLYIGQAGLGNKDEFGTLSLDKKENYCMGGPGMVFSRATLEKMVSHISFCLKNLYTTHEDVEIGRCVQKMADVSCTWAYEVMRSII